MIQFSLYCYHIHNAEIMHCIVFLLELQKMNGSNEKVYNFTLFKKILWHSKIQIYSKSQAVETL